MPVESVRHQHFALLQIDIRDFGREKSRVVQEFARGIHDRRCVQISFAATSCSIGVNRKKFSRFTRTVSTNG